MSQQRLSKEEAMNINLMLAHVKCLSEIIHTLPEHKYKFKSYFKRLFDTVKQYETALDEMTNYQEIAEDQEVVYDKMMELTYMLRDIILKDDSDT